MRLDSVKFLWPIIEDLPKSIFFVSGFSLKALKNSFPPTLLRFNSFNPYLF